MFYVYWKVCSSKIADKIIVICKIMLKNWPKWLISIPKFHRKCLLKVYFHWDLLIVTSSGHHKRHGQNKLLGPSPYTLEPRNKRFKQSSLLRMMYLTRFYLSQLSNSWKDPLNQIKCLKILSHLLGVKDRLALSPDNNTRNDKEYSTISKCLKAPLFLINQIQAPL